MLKLSDILIIWVWWFCLLCTEGARVCRFTQSCTENNSPRGILQWSCRHQASAPKSGVPLFRRRFDKVISLSAEMDNLLQQDKLVHWCATLYFFPPFPWTLLVAQISETMPQSAARCPKITSKTMDSGSHIQYMWVWHETFLNTRANVLGVQKKYSSRDCLIVAQHHKLKVYVFAMSVHHHGGHFSRGS